MTPSPSSRLKQLIAQTRVAHLATADANGIPHIVPICFAYDGTCLYSVIDRKPKRGNGINLKRVQNILANPRVSLLLDHYEENWDRLWYVLINGDAGILQGGQEHNEAIGLLRQKYPQYRKMAIEDRPVIRVRPIRIVSWGDPPEALTP